LGHCISPAACVILRCRCCVWGFGDRSGRAAGDSFEVWRVFFVVGLGLVGGRYFVWIRVLGLEVYVLAVGPCCLGFFVWTAVGALVVECLCASGLVGRGSWFVLSLVVVFR